MTKRSQTRQGMSPGLRNGLIIGGVVTVALIVLIIATFSAGENGGGDNSAQYAPVTVTGDTLPEFPEEGADTAIGMTMPDLAGQDFDGNPVSITNDGRPKVLLFLAHW